MAERSVARLSALWDRIDRITARPDDELLTRNASVSGWSVAEQLFHIGLANGLCFENALSLARRQGMRIKPFESVHPEALPMLERGTIPRGSATAPRFVRPPESDIDINVLRDVLAQERESLNQVSDRIDEVVSAPNVIKHQILGDFNAVEWLRFAHVHTVHHLLIVRDSLAALP